MTSPEALDAIEEALKAGYSRSIKAQAPLYAAAFEGLKVLRQEKRNGARRLIRALREGRGDAEGLARSRRTAFNADDEDGF